MIAAVPPPPAPLAELLRRLPAVTPHPSAAGWLAGCPLCRLERVISITWSGATWGVTAVCGHRLPDLTRAVADHPPGPVPPPGAGRRNGHELAPHAAAPEPHLASLARAVPGEVARHAPRAALPEADATALAAQGVPAEPPSLPLLGQAGYIVAGWSHLVSGYPKAGKTELLFQAVLPWLHARPALRVLWFSEESEALWRQRLAQAARRAPIPAGLRLVFALGAAPNALLARARDGDEAVVILDTLRYLLGIPDENDNARIAAALRPWEAALSQQGKTRIYVHHERKRGGEHGQAIAGGSAFLAVVDRALEVTFDEHDDRRRKITVRSRIAQPGDLLYERRADGALVALGSPDLVARAAVAARVYAFLAAAPAVWHRTSEVCDGLDAPRPSRRLVSELLDALHRAGRIERDPAEDRRGTTYRWRVSAGSASSTG